MFMTRFSFGAKQEREIARDEQGCAFLHHFFLAGDKKLAVRQLDPPPPSPDRVRRLSHLRE